jgi:hypothetical protein
MREIRGSYYDIYAIANDEVVEFVTGIMLAKKIAVNNWHFPSFSIWIFFQTSRASRGR